MQQQLMWTAMEARFRGQATNGSIVTVTQDALDMALKHAGRQVYETDWWVETLPQVIQNWGIYYRQTLDKATFNHCVDFSHESFETAAPEPADHSFARSSSRASGPLGSTPPSGPLPNPGTSGSLSDRLSGPLNNRMLSGPLGDRPSVGPLSDRLSGNPNPKDADRR